MVTSQITEWEFTISHCTVSNYWNKYRSQDLGNYSKNYGKKPVLDEYTKQLMIDRVRLDRWMTATALGCDKDLNPDGVSADTI